MINKKLITTVLCLCPAFVSMTHAQDKLYPELFPLSDVQLLDGPFKHAQDLNRSVLLEYDVDRLLAPFLIEAGLKPKAEKFPNWPGLDGHVAGHYLSAMAMNYRAGDGEEFKRRMEYMLSELYKCQQANGDGYIGGIPNGKAGWKEIKKGNVGIIWKYWAPWYNLHKLYAGLRDAWLYADSELAKKMFLDYCDWGIGVISGLNDEQMEQMLNNEFGGMNEVFADAYQISGETKYLDAAKRFSHKWLFESMRDGKDNLDNKHANTQVPKAVGYQRVAELSVQAKRSGDAVDYTRAAYFFWQTVTANRSLAFGGNSRREHFPDDADYLSYVDDREGPESCNTYNMLRLTEGLFRKDPKAAYADFYERALFNHILSTQHPVHGGYVYFTPARPAHYRVYSAPNEAMWCCVGTGMENHGKYGEFIYAHTGDSLYVNLFISSRLEWKKRRISLTQTTSFPNEGKTCLTITAKKSTKFPLFVRKPGWVGDGKVIITVNGKSIETTTAANSYYTINRKWKNGDVVEVQMPMNIRIEELKHHPEYIAIMRGPILLGANVGKENLNGLVASDHRWGHIAHGPLVSLFDTPMIIGDREKILQKLSQMKPVAGKPCTFTVPGLFEDKYAELELQPFASLHDCRYMIYWLSMSDSQYRSYQAEKKDAEKKRLQLDARTVDMVTCGEQQPEIDHNVKSNRSGTGNTHGAAWRKANNDGYFTYELSTNGKATLSLCVTYWGNENGNCRFSILINDQLLTNENLQNKWNSDKFMTVEYPIPTQMLKGKQQVSVTFKSQKGTTAGPIYSLRLLNQQWE